MAAAGAIWRRKAEMGSRRLSLQVMHLNRAAEAGALSASFAHELGQPTLAIALNTQMAESLLSKDPPELGKIKEACSTLAEPMSTPWRSSSSLENYSSAGAIPRFREIDLNGVIADALHILSPEANPKVVLVAEGDKGPLPVRADRIHLQQVLLNLVTNAMDAMADNPPDTRRITIRTAMRAD